MIELLHFTADWCNPCKRIKPIIEDYIAKHPDVKWTLIDVDIQFDIAKIHNVQSVPTLIVLVDGIENKRHSGVLSSAELAELLS